MAAKPRLYFFSGSDTRSSLQAVARWRTLFEEKHGSFASFRIDADELEAGAFARELEACLQSDTLFQEPRLVVIRRVTSQEKGNSAPYTKALVEFLKRPSWRDDTDLTLVIWEEKELAPAHALASCVAGLEKEGAAKTYGFSVPTVQGLPVAVKKRLAEHGQDIAPDALRWLSDQHAWIERRARLEKRLKPGEAWADDYRGWWLHQLLEGASLRAADIVSLADLQASHREAGEPVGAFDVADAMASGSWKQARKLLTAFAAESADPGDYFSLLAALRWRLQRRTGLRQEIADQAVRLLGEVELAAKNGIPNPGWLLALALVRFEKGEMEPLLPYRTLWLSQLPRPN